jgi:hypothetical protein
MSKRNYIIGGSVLAVVVSFGFFRSCDKKKDLKTGSELLAQAEEEAIIIDPVRGSIKIVKPGSVRTLDLPDRPTRVSILKNGSVKVVAPQYGTELRPFLVGAYDLNGGKLGIGSDFYYYKRFDLGGGLLVNPSQVKDTTIFVGISYFVYSNTSVTLGINNQLRPMVGIKVRL